MRTVAGHLVDIIRNRYIQPLQVTMDNDGNITVSKTCSVTKQDYFVTAHKGKFIAWLYNGGLIQNIFTSLDDNQREFLISGTTPAEWDVFMPSEEEE